MTTNTNIQSPQEGNHHKTTSWSSSSFKVFETDNDSYGYGSSSSSEETADQNYSPKTVISKVRNFENVFRCRVRNQIERIIAEDSYLGEDIAEYYLIAKACGVGHDHHVDFMMFSRPASPLSGKVAPRISLVQ